MNKERLLELANIIENGQHKFNGVVAAFDMSSWLETTYKVKESDDYKEAFTRRVPKRKDIKDPYACNTVACMAGFACLLFDEECRQNPDAYFNVEDKAMKILELSEYEASKLFVSKTYQYITGKRAASVIRHFVETNVIDWNLFSDDDDD